MADVLHAAHHDAWFAAKESDSADIHGAVVQELCVALTPPLDFLKDTFMSVDSKADLDLSTSATPPPDGFVLTGTIDIFGLDGLRTDFYSHHAPPPAYLNLPEHVPPIHQLAIVRGPLHASKLFPEFAGTPVDVIKLDDVKVTYQVRVA